MGAIPVGIDLGTTYSALAYLDNQGRPSTAVNAEGDMLTPSAVFFDRTGPVVGKEAVKAAEFEPDRVARFAKRNMGEAAYDKAIGGRRFPPEVIQALVLQKLKRDAEHRLGPIAEAVVTVPAYFDEPRRKATQDAGRLAGLRVLDIINEPTAAALAFGVQRGFLTSQGQSRRRETILVYDLGGGTFDATVMAIDGQRYETLATAGDVFLGGIDWDRRIVDFVAERFDDEFGIDLREDNRAMETLLSESQDAKHALTAREEVHIPFAHEGRRLRAALARDQFEEMTGDLLDRTALTVDRVLKEAGCAPGDLTRVILAGGSTRMPMIRRMLETKTGLAPDCSLSADEAVAHGAAIYAGLVLGDARLPCAGMSVANVNAHDLGVLGIEPDTRMRRRKVLIARNTRLPAVGAGTFVTQRRGQTNVLVDVVEGGDATGAGATHIGRCVVTDLPQDLPAGTPVRVTFNYASNGRLTVGAALPGTERRARTTIQRAAGLSDDRLRGWQQRFDEGTVGIEPWDARETDEPAQQRPFDANEADPLQENSWGVFSPDGKGTPDRTAGVADPALQEFLQGLDR